MITSSYISSFIHFYHCLWLTVGFIEREVGNQWTHGETSRYTCPVYPQSLSFNEPGWKILKWESRVRAPALILMTCLAVLCCSRMDLHHVSMSVSPFLLRHFNFHTTLFFWTGWRLKSERSKLVTGSLNSCERPGRTGRGKLMCNALLYPGGYCQGATEQGTYCMF